MSNPLPKDAMYVDNADIYHSYSFEAVVLGFCMLIGEVLKGSIPLMRTKAKLVKHGKQSALSFKIRGTNQESSFTFQK